MKIKNRRKKAAFEEVAAPQVEHVVALFRRGQEVVLDTPEQLSIVIVNMLCKNRHSGPRKGLESRIEFQWKKPNQAFLTCKDQGRRQ